MTGSARLALGCGVLLASLCGGLAYDAGKDRGVELWPSPESMTSLWESFRSCGVVDVNQADPDFRKTVELMGKGVGQEPQPVQPAKKAAGAKQPPTEAQEYAALRERFENAKKGNEQLEVIADQLRDMGRGDPTKKASADLYLALSYLFQAEYRGYLHFSAPAWSAISDVYSDPKDKRRAGGAWNVCSVQAQLVYLEIAERYLDRAQAARPNLRCSSELREIITAVKKDRLASLTEFQKHAQGS